MTAALMAPRPKKATQGGVKYCRQRGKTKLVSLFSTLGLLPYSVSSHLKKKKNFSKITPHLWSHYLSTYLVALAMAPNTTEGAVIIRAISPPPYESSIALLDVFEERTLW